MAKKRVRERPQVHSGNEYIRNRLEEFMLCRTQGCRNVIAKWATGNGYCAECRKKS